MGTTWGQVGTEIRIPTQPPFFEDLLRRRQTDPRWQAETTPALRRGRFRFGRPSPAWAGRTHPLLLGNKARPGDGCRGPFRPHCSVQPYHHAWPCAGMLLNFYDPRENFAHCPRFVSATCAGCLPSSVWLLPIYLSVLQSPRPPSLSASAGTHWPDVGTVLDRWLGPPPGPGQKDH